MMLPISRFKGQPVSMVPTTPWLSISSDPAPPWFWLASWSASTYQAACPPGFYLPAVWIPEHTHLIQWERPAVEIVPILPPFYQISPIHSHHPLSKLAKCWVSPEDVGVHPRRDKAFFLTNQSIIKPAGHTPLRHLLPSSSQFSGGTLWDVETFPSPKHDEVCSSVQPCQPIISHKRRPAAPMQKRVFGPVGRSQLCIDRWSVFPLQVIKEVCPSFMSSRFSTKFSLLTNIRHKRPGMCRGKVSYKGTLVLRTAEGTSNNRQCVGVSLHKTKEEDKEEADVDEEKEEDKKDKRPVASTPVPGSPWCVVWTGDDRVFFFNPTIHLSVWERPGELIGYDISDIIKNPPHKRKKMESADSSSICQSPGLHGNDDDDEHNHEHSSKKKRMDESLSLVPHRGEVKILPVELRITHFREMMLERGVSAFSTWEKELHKMVFDPRYLLLTSDQRKQVFDQFVKSRVKDEYREKRSKKQKAREEFKLLLEEAKITSRSTFKEFCGRCRGDQRFHTVNRKKERKVLFNQFIKSLKKRDKDIKDGMKKMR
uniref:Transcription elongation regulator 1-like n=3 Tax=Iconisemion striatum TaxID=60296 RepID=A0A1A7YM70_9TELE